MPLVNKGIHDHWKLVACVNSSDVGKLPGKVITLVLKLPRSYAARSFSI